MTAPTKSTLTAEELRRLAACAEADWITMPSESYETRAISLLVPGDSTLLSARLARLAASLMDERDAMRSELEAARETLEGMTIHCEYEDLDGNKRVSYRVHGDYISEGEHGYDAIRAAHEAAKGEKGEKG